MSPKPRNNSSSCGDIAAATSGHGAAIAAITAPPKTKPQNVTASGWTVLVAIRLNTASDAPQKPAITHDVTPQTEK